MEGNRSGYYYGYIIVAAMFLIMVMIWGTVSSFGVFFESILQEFGWTRALISGASSTRNLVFGFACIVTARLTEHFGPRVVVTFCGLMLGIGYFMTAKSAANILAILGALCVVGMNISGQSADRIGNKQTLIISFILMTVSFLILLVARTACKEGF